MVINRILRAYDPGKVSKITREKVDLIAKRFFDKNDGKPPKEKGIESYLGLERCKDSLSETVWWIRENIGVISKTYLGNTRDISFYTKASVN